MASGEPANSQQGLWHWLLLGFYTDSEIVIYGRDHGLNEFQED
jgi:hypothetical protein